MATAKAACDSVQTKPGNQLRQSRCFRLRLGYEIAADLPINLPIKLLFFTGSDVCFRARSGRHHNLVKKSAFDPQRLSGCSAANA